MGQLDHHACDVLIAGSGAGGFAAALTARHHGLDVLVVEKETLFGGTTAYSAGVIWIPVNSHQAAAGISDSREDALAYLTHHVGNRLDRAKAEAFVDNGSRMFELFEREGIVSFSPALTWADYHPKEPGASQGGRALCPDDFDGRQLGSWFDKLRPPLKTMTAFGGMMVGRNDLPHVFQMTRSMRSALHVARMLARQARDRLSYRRGTRLVNGNALIASLAVNAFQRGIPLWLASPIVELVREGDDVTGAIVEREGRRLQIKTRRGVVLACGGFPSNDELRHRVYRHVADGRAHVSMPPTGNAGDGLRLAQSAGGAFHDQVHQPAAWAPASLVPQRDGSVVPFPHFFDRGKPGYICVNRRGRRFVNEAMSYHVFVPAMIEASQDDQDAEAWIICDHRAIRRFGLGALGPAPMRVKPFMRSGYIKRSNTIAGLAGACGIDAAGLERTIRGFNGPARLGEDPEFRRGSDAYQRFNGAPGHKPNPCVKGPIRQLALPSVPQ
jgi:succinate dehydrogenase/fumarate reductase flavoprotein subunit